MNMKITVPCDVEIRRFYRMYVTVDENATDAEIKAAARKDILDYGEEVLTPDPDLNIESHDIFAIIPDHDAEWTEE